MLLHLRRALCQKYVLHETLQALNLTVVNSINHNFSKNIFFADLKGPRESPDSQLSIGPIRFKKEPVLKKLCSFKYLTYPPTFTDLYNPVLLKQTAPTYLSGTQLLQKCPRTKQPRRHYSTTSLGGRTTPLRRHYSTPLRRHNSIVRCSRRIKITLALSIFNNWAYNYCNPAPTNHSAPNVFSYSHIILCIYTTQPNQLHPVPTHSHTVRPPPLQKCKPNQSSRPGGTGFFRCHTQQPYHHDRTPLQILVYPPVTHTPRRIRNLVDSKAITAALTLAKWLAIHSTTTALPRVSMCIAGASLITNVLRERAQGGVSRRHKLALGLVILMAHVAVGESVKTCATLPLHEVESKSTTHDPRLFLGVPSQALENNTWV